MKTKAINQELLQSYSDDIPLFLKSIYATRNLKEDDLDLSLKNLLQPDFADLNKALELLTNAILKDKKVLIVGDFDADGATSCALSITAFKSFGFSNVDFLTPNRFIHGYGLSPMIVEIAKLEFSPDIIITVDNGISSFDGVQLANSYGIKVIITDHHLPSEKLPNAYAIINPNLKDCNFKSKNLAGVGVAFYLFSSLKTHLQKQNYFTNNNIPIPDMRNLLDLVALGTVADVVPLDRNNKILVSEGLKIIRSDRCNKGIAALIKVAKRVREDIKASDLGFTIAPRINASGRLDDISIGIKCLLSIENSVAFKYAVVLDEFNQERKLTQENMLLEAEKIVKHLDNTNDDFAISVYDGNWHEGVVGIVAGKLKEEYHLPSIVFANSGEFLKGSARSIPNLHIKDLLDLIDRRHPHLIDKFGGHAMAAGLSIKLENFDTFSTIFKQEVKNYFAGVKPEFELLTDGELSAGQINFENAKLLESHIWGNSFEEPIFYGEFLLKEQRVVGEKHLKLRIALEGLVFDAMAFFTDVLSEKNLKIAYKLNINNYMNRQNLQLIVEKFYE